MEIANLHLLKFNVVTTIVCQHCNNVLASGRSIFVVVTDDKVSGHLVRKISCCGNINDEVPLLFDTPRIGLQFLESLKKGDCSTNHLFYSCNLSGLDTVLQDGFKSSLKDVNQNIHEACLDYATSSKGMPTNVIKIGAKQVSWQNSPELIRAGLVSGRDLVIALTKGGVFRGPIKRVHQDNSCILFELEWLAKEEGILDGWILMVPTNPQSHLLRYRFDSKETLIEAVGSDRIRLSTPVSVATIMANDSPLRLEDLAIVK